MDFFIGNLQKKISARPRNHLASIPINDRQKKFRANTIIKNIISDTHHISLRE